MTLWFSHQDENHLPISIKPGREQFFSYIRDNSITTSATSNINAREQQWWGFDEASTGQ
jgi:hypothetical protein